MPSDAFFDLLRDDVREMRGEMREGFADQRIYINGKFQTMEGRVRILEDARERGSFLRRGGGWFVYFVLGAAISAMAGMIAAKVGT